MKKINKKNDKLVLQEMLLISNTRLDHSRNTIYNIVVSLSRVNDVDISGKSLEELDKAINDVENSLVKIVKECQFKMFKSDKVE